MIQPARHRRLFAADLHWIAGGLVVLGGVIAIVVGAGVEVLLRRRRAD